MKIHAFVGSPIGEGIGNALFRQVKILGKLPKLRVPGGKGCAKSFLS